LTALAETVDQRGEQLGALIETVDGYLNEFNPHLPELVDDLRAGDDVLAIYEQARPDLTRLLTDLAVTGDTLVADQSRIQEVAEELQRFSDGADALLTDTRRPLKTSLAAFAPVTAVLAKYSPELPCTILGLASLNPLAEAAVGGTNPGVTTITRLIPGRDPYTMAENLPVVGDQRGPGCQGLPYVTPEEAEQAAPAFTTGANPYSGPQPDAPERVLVTLTNLLLGGGNLL
jgi:phospholipid/cholesterol/gamma-HCH transport system substrate-binding protein